MILSEDKIKELLKWFVNSSETNKNWMPARKECEAVNHEWIQPELIEKMSDKDFKDHYMTYFKNGTGKKQNLIQIPLNKILNNEKLRKSLLYLLNEKIDIKIRIDELLDTKNEKHIDGMGKAFITAFLMDFKPNKYCLWNGKTQMGLDSLGYKSLYYQKGDSSGDIYVKVIDLLKKLKNFDPELNLTYLDIDLFLHTISAEEEGKIILDKIIGNDPNLGIRYFIKKTLTDYNSKKQEDIDEIRDLFERRVPKYLEKIANENLTTNDRIYKAKGGAGNSQINSTDEMSYLPEVQLYFDSKGKNQFDQYYIIYKLREDRKGIYLSLNHSQSFMKGILEEKGEYDGWFKDNFENGLKLEASKARNTLNFKPEGLSESMDLGAKNAKSARMYEASTVYSKYYTLDNLPTEEALISNFKEILKLYDLLVGEGNILEIIENPDEIKEAEYKFRDILFHKADEIIENIHWSNDLGIGFRYTDDYNRYFNGFGIVKPDLDVKMPVFCEINIEKKGLNKKTGGAFAKDLQENLFIIHRGNIAGINKTEFFDKYTGKTAQIQDGNTKTDVVIIGDLNDHNLPKDIKNFVFEVCKIKKGEECLNNQNFFEYLSEKGYLFDQKLVENFLLSLKVKQFVILTGNSGTGKTKIAQLFAQYLDMQEELTPKKIYAQMLSLTRSVTKYSRSHNGGWRLKPDEINDLLKYVDSGNLSELSDNLYLELNNNNKTIRGKCILKEKLQSYSPDPQVYIYYDNDSTLLNELNNLNGEVNLHLVKKEYKTIPEGRYEIVPVGANWTENRHVLGFYNVITEKYQKTQALDLILKASKEIEDLEDNSGPYFLILDEMNLSHVERYFSDFLSAMESEDPIHLHDNKGLEVPKWKIELPNNLLVIGTVNVDETTYMFSPKVLDRANTLEFLTLPAENYMSSSPEYNVEDDLDYLLNPLSDIGIRGENINQLKNRFNNVKTIEGKALWDELSFNLNHFQQILKKADFDFGFRTINEIVRFMYVAWNYDKNVENQFKWDNWKRYFDAQIMQKMLPKLHGSQKELADVLKELEEYCIKENFQESSKKLEKMIKTLKDKRYVSFTG